MTKKHRSDRELANDLTKAITRTERELDLDDSFALKGFLLDVSRAASRLRHRVRKPEGMAHASYPLRHLHEWGGKLTVVPFDPEFCGKLGDRPPHPVWIGLPPSASLDPPFEHDLRLAFEAGCETLGDCPPSEFERWLEDFYGPGDGRADAYVLDRMDDVRLGIEAKLQEGDGGFVALPRETLRGWADQLRRRFSEAAKP